MRGNPAQAADPEVDSFVVLQDSHDLALGAGRLATWEMDGDDTLSTSGHLSAVMGDDVVDQPWLLSRLLEPVRATMTAGSVNSYEMRSTLANGRAVLVRASATAHGAAGVILDVSGQRDAEQDLVDLIDRYRLLVELSPDGIVVHEGGVVRYANPAAARYAATVPDDMVGHSVLDFIDPGDLGETVQRIADLTEPGMVSEPSVAILRGLDGQRHRFESVSVRTSWEGRPAYQVILRDLTDRDRAEHAAAAQARLVEAVSDAILACDQNMVVTSWNPAAEHMYGWTTDEAIGTELAGLLDITSNDIDEQLHAHGTWTGDVRHRRKDGSHVEVHMSVTQRRHDGNPDGVVMICTDITARKAAEAARRAAERRYSTVVESLDEGILVISAEGNIEAANAAAGRAVGVASAELLGSPLDGRSLVRIYDAGGMPLRLSSWPGVETMRSGVAVNNLPVCVERLDGERRWVSVNSQPLGDGGGGIVISFKDITEQRLAQQQVAWAATHDPLTHLPNRAAVLEELGDGLRRPGGRHVAVIFGDLDRFKEINDSLGHEAGDATLIEVADRLSRTVRAGDMVGRLAGDEFVVVCRDISLAEARGLATRMASSVTQPIELSTPGAHTVRVGISVGIALSTPDADAAGLLRDADVAMYAAKGHEGASPIALFDENMRNKAQRRLRTREDLRTAVEADALEVYYQPIGDTCGSQVRGFEALCRWNHPERGFISPDEFIPLAEESGIISALGTFVLQDACAQVSKWRRDGQDVYVTVNVSANQLVDGSLVASVSDALARNQLDPAGLWLEVTESALAEDPAQSGSVLAAVKALGVRIAVDDFGTGYSSLARLRTFPVDALKIDRSFVADLGDRGDGDSSIVEAVIALSHRLNLLVVAEGVETPGQLDALDAMGADLAQGWLLGRPVPAPQVRFGGETAGS